MVKYILSYKWILFVFLGTVMSSVLSAQTPDAILGQIRKHAAESCVTVTYSIDASSDEGVLADRGVVTAQDDMWHLKGKALEMYTDGTSTWVLDMKSKEAVVEPAWTYDDLERFYDSVLAAGADVDIKMLSVSISEKKDPESFRPSFSSDWIVTDLR